MHRHNMKYDCTKIDEYGTFSLADQWNLLPSWAGAQLANLVPTGPDQAQLVPTKPNSQISILVERSVAFFHCSITIFYIFHFNLGF